MKKVIVITGGSSGMGKATAKRLVGQGHTIIILSDKEEKLKAAAAEAGCDYELCDVTNPEQVQSAVEKIKSKHGRIDVLLNSAGIWTQGPLEEHTYEETKKLIDVNTLGTIYFTKAVTPLMKEQKGGLVINIISQAGIYANPERAVYTASKFALTGFTKSLQPELAPFGIRVTGVYPGKVETPIFEEAGYKKEMGDALHVDEIAKLMDFIINSDEKTQFPEIGVKNIDNW